MNQEPEKGIQHNKSSLKGLFARIAGTVVLTTGLLALMACSDGSTVQGTTTTQGTMPASSINESPPPTPYVYKSDNVRTEWPYDTENIDELPAQQEAYCTALNDDIEQLPPQGDSFLTVSPLILDSVGSALVTKMEELAVRYNSMAPPGCAFNDEHGVTIILKEPGISSTEPLGIVSNASLNCGVDELPQLPIVINTTLIRSIAQQREVDPDTSILYTVAHELGHSCRVDRGIVEITGLDNMQVYSYSDSVGFDLVSTQKFSKIHVRGFDVFGITNRIMGSETYYSQILSEIEADLRMLRIMNVDLSQYRDMTELPMEIKIQMAYYTSFSELDLTLWHYGYDLSPQDYYDMFNVSFNSENPLATMADILETYPSQTDDPLSVLVSFALSHPLYVVDSRNARPDDSFGDALLVNDFFRGIPALPDLVGVGE